MSDSPDSVLRHAAGQRELKEEFARADKDHDRRIDFAEFAQLMQGLQAEMSHTDLRIGFQEIDSDHDGLIDFGEFADWWRAD